MQATAQKKKNGKVLDFIERVGNRLPHPYILFLWLCLILALISLACSMAGVSVVNPTNGETVLAKSLISKDGLIWLLENLLSNFQGFSPLGLVLAMQIAIGFSEKVGLLTTAMRRAILGVPLWALTATVLFLGINGSIASEASIIVVPALAAAAFESVGMHPIAGLLAGYAATNAGFTACVIVAGTDVLLAGVTESAAQMIDPSMTVNATCNWYFMFVSVFTLTAVGVFVNKKFIVPRLGTYDPADGEGGKSTSRSRHFQYSVHPVICNSGHPVRWHASCGRRFHLKRTVHQRTCSDPDDLFHSGRRCIRRKGWYHQKQF